MSPLPQIRLVATGIDGSRIVQQILEDLTKQFRDGGKLEQECIFVRFFT